MYYELMVVAKVDGASATFEKVEKTLKELSFANVAVSKLGKKPLAYNIKSQADGEFSVYNFEGEGEPVNTLSSKLRLEQETILRYLILKVKPSKAVAKTVEANNNRESTRVTVKAVAEPKKAASETKGTKVAKVTKRAEGTKGTNGAKGTKVAKVTKGKKK